MEYNHHKVNQLVFSRKDNTVNKQR